MQKLFSINVSLLALFALSLSASFAGEPLVNATSVSVPSAATTSGELVPAPAPIEIPATTREFALEQARLGAGRTDPFTPFVGYKQFPTLKQMPVQQIAKKHVPAFVPPPPPASLGIIAPGAANHGLITPPPPVSEGVPISELPAPPERPSLASKLKLVGIVGDRALLACTDPVLRAESRLPACVSLGAGEQLETVSVVSVSADGVVLEEDGERETKELPRIR